MIENIIRKLIKKKDVCPFLDKKQHCNLMEGRYCIIDNYESCQHYQVNKEGDHATTKL